MQCRSPMGEAGTQSLEPSPLHRRVCKGKKLGLEARAENQTQTPRGGMWAGQLLG